MTTEELQASLTVDQRTAVNALLIEQRAALQEAHSSSEQELISAHAALSESGETAKGRVIDLEAHVVELNSQIQAGLAEISSNESLQAQLVAAATQAANARDWDAIDAVILQAHDTPAVIRDNQAKAKQAQKDILLAEIAEREKAIADLG